LGDATGSSAIWDTPDMLANVVGKAVLDPPFEMELKAM
jgi:hypothetical protein